MTPDSKTVDLPLNKPVEVAVTVPATGEVGFACGMDMFHGTVVADEPEAHRDDEARADRGAA